LHFFLIDKFPAVTLMVKSNKEHCSNVEVYTQSLQHSINSGHEDAEQLVAVAATAVVGRAAL